MSSQNAKYNLVAPSIASLCLSTLRQGKCFIQNCRASITVVDFQEFSDATKSKLLLPSNARNRTSRITSRLRPRISPPTNIFRQGLTNLQKHDYFWLVNPGYFYFLRVRKTTTIDRPRTGYKLRGKRRSIVLLFVLRKDNRRTSRQQRQSIPLLCSYPRWYQT